MPRSWKLQHNHYTRVRREISLTTVTRRMLKFNKWEFKHFTLTPNDFNGFYFQLMNRGLFVFWANDIIQQNSLVETLVKSSCNELSGAVWSLFGAGRRRVEPGGAEWKTVDSGGYEFEGDTIRIPMIATYRHCLHIRGSKMDAVVWVESGSDVESGSNVVPRTNMK